MKTNVLCYGDNLEVMHKYAGLPKDNVNFCYVFSGKAASSKPLELRLGR